MAAFRLLRLPLGPARFDASRALEGWLSASGSKQGFVIEKAGGSVAWLAADPFEAVRVRGGRAVSERDGVRRALPGNPFAAIGERLAAFRVPGARPFETAAVGSLSYEMARHLERIPASPEAEEAFLMLYPAVVVADRRRSTATLCAIVRDEASVRRARSLAAVLMGIFSRPSEADTFRAGTLKGARGKAAFLKGVRSLKESIGAGDIFQGVVSESFSAPFSGSAPALYRRLRAVGAGPYLFYLRDGERHLLGASPERLVRVEGGVAYNWPIAGTKPRGKTKAQDLALERELRASPKERAEHMMLVDLGRNDLGRVCAPGTVKVETLMATRRFPNVMHLVSEVSGRLERGATAWETLAASFPAGTVSGAPKVRAMELLAKLERRPRGFYAGAIVQGDLSGNLDSCIAIRSAEVKGGRVRIQAGAGIVADSDPESEYQEVLHKLGSLRRALA